MDLMVVGAFPFPLPFGSQILLRGQAVGLARRGHRVRVATYGHGLGAWPEGVERVDVPSWAAVGVLRSGPSVDRPLQDGLLLRAVIRSVRVRPPDVVLAHHVEAVAVMAAARRLTGQRWPLVYVCHTSVAQELPDHLPAGLGALAAHLGRAVDRASLALSDAHLVLSPEGEGRVSAMSAKPTWLIPPGVDPSELAGGDAARARARWDLGEGAWVLYTGNLDRYQEVDRLVDAMRSVPGAGLLVHTRDDARRLDGMLPARRLRVAPSETLSDLRDALAVAQLVVVPRRTCAGFPMKILNALAVGVPVICAEGSAPRVAGVVPVQGDRIDDLARSIEDALADPVTRRCLGAEGALAIGASWSWDARSGELEQRLATLPS